MIDGAKSGRKPAWHLKPIQLVGCALLVLSAPLWFPIQLLLILLVSPLLHHRHSVEEGRFLQRMKDRGRLIEWEEIQTALEAGEGTLIVVHGIEGPDRVWWTLDAILGSAPSPPPSWDEIDDLFFEPGPHPFVDWCHRRYIDEHTGSAMLSHHAETPRGFISSDFFRERYPRIAAIDTIHPAKGRGHAA